MLRWFIVCALLAQTLALSRPSRRAWPSWMDHSRWRLPTQDDLPDVAIPDIDWPKFPTLPRVEIPDIQMPEINIKMPSMGNLWDPLQRSRNNGERNGEHRDTALPPAREMPQRGSSNIYGQRSWPSQNDRHRPTQTDTTLPNKRRKQRPQPREEVPQRQEPSQTDTQRPGKSRKQRPQPREGPPQRQELARDDSQRLPTWHPQSRPHTEPSVIQQLDEFRIGMPREMQERLSDTFESMKRRLDQGRLRMDSWADDINTAAQEWWQKWSGSRNTNSRFSGRPTGDLRGETTRPEHPRSRGHHTYGDRHRSHPHNRGESRYPSKGGCRRPFRPPTERPSKEEPEYKVLCAGNDYEARLYNSSVWVSVTVKALTFNLGLHKAFMRLFDYINGDNSNGAKIPMTVPVRTKVQFDSRENRWFERHNYTISFYVPYVFHDNPPIPNDPELFLDYDAPTVYYVHTFRGFAMEFNIWEYLEELTNTLDVNQESYLTENFLVNGYDPPWKFFNRRNEILVAMDTNSLEAPRCEEPTPETPTTSQPEVTTAAKTTVPPVTTIRGRTTSVAKTTALATTKAPVTDSGLLPVPAEINFQGHENPFDNNDLEQQMGIKCEPGSECPRQSTAVMFDGFELRHYAYSRWICMDQPACDIETAQIFTQGPLLEYFFPKGNREQTAMRLTTPLVIGLDVSDLNSADCSKVYTSCLFIPEEHQSAPPTPRDARLFIQDIPAMSRYVRPFGGFATSQNVPKLGVEFLTDLDNSQQVYDGSILAVAQYTTSKLAKTHHNELWVMDQSLLFQGELPLE